MNEKKAQIQKLYIFQCIVHILITVKHCGEIQFCVVKVSCGQGFYLSRKRKSFIEVLCKPNLFFFPLVASPVSVCGADGLIKKKS